MKQTVKFAISLSAILISDLCFALNSEPLADHSQITVPASPLERPQVLSTAERDIIFPGGVFGKIRAVPDETMSQEMLGQMASKISVLETQNRNLLETVSILEQKIRRYDEKFLLNDSGYSDFEKQLLALTKSVQNSSQEVAVLKKDSRNLRNSFDEGFRELKQNLKDFKSISAVEKSERLKSVKALENSLSENLTTSEMRHLEDSRMFDRLSLSIVIIALGYVFVFLVFIVFFSGKFRKQGDLNDEFRYQIDRLSADRDPADGDLASLNERLITLMEKGGAVAPDCDETTAVLDVANEIARIQTNLFRMDKSVKGYKQLERAVERIVEIFGARGYEIRNLIGSEYSENLRCSATFTEDESTEDGKQIITGVKKAMVIYNGKMIQTPEITVSSKGA